MKRSRSYLATGVGVFIAASTLALATAAPANAATDRDNDPINDAAVVAEAGEGAQGSTSTNKTAEIRFATVGYGGRVVFKMGVTDLKPNDQVGGYGLIKTPNGDTYQLRSVKNSNGTELALLKNDNQTDCSGRSLSSKFDANANVISLEVARTCIGSPPPSSEGVSAAAFKRNGDIVVDDARRANNPPESPDGAKIGANNVRYN